MNRLTTNLCAALAFTTTSMKIPALLIASLALHAAAKEIPAQLPDPDTKPPAKDKPVKVYILLGQSNMVGMGDISGGTSRWGPQILNPVVSVYAGDYSPTADYDKITPIATKELPVYGGVHPTPFPGGGVQVVRGHIQMKTSGVYEFNPGYAASTYNLMEVDGVEVYRREVGKDPVHTEFKFSAGKEYPFKITFLTKAANGLGWFWRTDIPGTLHPLVHADKKFEHLVNDQGKWTVRNDVIYKGVISAVAQGPLAVGLQGNTIGPELQFGHVMGYYHDEPVLLIRDVEVSPRNQGHHYNRNAETYLLVGDALGRGMVRLLEGNQ